MHPIIARQGYPIILTIFVISGVLFLLACLAEGQFSFVLKIFSGVFFLFFIFSLSFFRDPERKNDYSPKDLISPADGTIIDVKEVIEPQYLKKNAKRVSIFMSVFNVHVNRSPINGFVDFVKYNPGKFISAFKEKASEDNESLFVGLQARQGSVQIGVKFIAGLIARRIVFYKKLNDAVVQGERINMIKFGSRVDLFCPINAEIKIKKGDKVFAGQTVIAVLQD